MRPARGMRRRESSIASRRPVPRPPVMIFDARRITWRWPKSAPNCRPPAPRSKSRNRSSVARRPRWRLRASSGAEAAAAGLTYLQEHPGAPARLVLAVAQLCYDVGHRSHEPQWYEDATRLCRTNRRPSGLAPRGSPGPAYHGGQPTVRAPRGTHRRTAQGVRTSGTRGGGRSRGVALVRARS